VLRTSEIAAKIIARFTNRALSALRNHQDLALSREEIRYSRISFSQFGEDLALLRWLDEDLKPVPQVYVDAGCFHPIFFSNTLLLHKRGWRGVNIDASPQKIEHFKNLRPDDFNVVAVLSDSDRQVRFQDDGCLTDCVSEDVGRITKATTINTVLDKTRWRNFQIGYLNIDCEGHDFSVLRGIDLAIYRPAMITIESFDPENSEIRPYLERHGYCLRETHFWTMLFVREDACTSRKSTRAA
jgi:hypothetical protein